MCLGQRWNDEVFSGCTVVGQVKCLKADGLLHVFQNYRTKHFVTYANI